MVCDTDFVKEPEEKDALRESDADFESDREKVRVGEDEHVSVCVEMVMESEDVIVCDIVLVSESAGLCE